MAQTALLALIKISTLIPANAAKILALNASTLQQIALAVFLAALSNTSIIAFVIVFARIQHTHQATNVLPVINR